MLVVFSWKILFLQKVTVRLILASLSLSVSRRYDVTLLLHQAGDVLLSLIRSVTFTSFITEHLSFLLKWFDSLDVYEVDSEFLSVFAAASVCVRARALTLTLTSFYTITRIANSCSYIHFIHSLFHCTEFIKKKKVLSLEFVFCIADILNAYSRYFSYHLLWPCS